jgi:hypothetical protein
MTEYGSGLQSIMLDLFSADRESAPILTGYRQ